MSVYDFYQRKMKVDSNSTGKNFPMLGEKLKHDSDLLMESTWSSDVQSKRCFIYDYFHDDQPDRKDHMTYDHTTKTMIDAKFIVKSYQSIDKDQVDYYLQFKPSQKTEFIEGDELYYFETDYRKKYGNDDFIGLYVDIPDDRGIYRKWLIVRKEIANQFVKFLILPINYQLMWVETKGQARIKRRMWSVLKMQSSYNSGLWTDLRFTSQENQDKIWLPLNSITEKIWYTNDQSQNMRVLVSAFTENPIAWTISKVETANNLGLQMLTLYQDFYDSHRDYIEKDSDGNIIGLWANYYDSNIEPIDPETPSPTPSSIYGKIEASTSTIKVGGSYKNLTLKLFDSNGEDITGNYSSADFKWTCSITDKDKTTDLTELVSWHDGKEFNQRKIKFPDNRDYLGKVLDVKCVVDGIETVEKFELVI